MTQNQKISLDFIYSKKEMVENYMCEYDLSIAAT